MATYDELLADEQRDEHFVVVASPRDPDTGAAVDGYYSDRGRMGQLANATEPMDTPANQRFDAVVLSAAGYESDVIDPLAVAQVPTIRGGSLSLGQRFGHLDGLRDQLWDGAAISVKHGGIGRTGRVAWADYGTIVEAEASQALVGLNRVEVALRDPRERMESPALVRRFREVGDYALQWGTTSSASLGSPAKLDIAGDVVIECWWRPEQTAANASLIGWTGGTRRPWHFRMLAGGTMTIAATDAGGSIVSVTTTDTLTAGRPYHLVAIRVGTAVRIAIYDEASSAELVTSGTMAAAAAQAGATCRLGLATEPALGLAHGEWRVWVPPADIDETLELVRSRRMRRLTSAEIAAQPYAYVCRFGEGTGTSLADAGSGTAATGSITGTVAWRASLVPPVLVGQRIRRGIGRVKRLEPLPVDPANLIYLVVGHRINAISALTAGGSTITLGTVRGTITGMQGAVPAAGTYDEFRGPDATYIKLGSAPTRPLQVTFTGDATGSVYVENVGAAAQRALETLGQQPFATAEIDTAALGSLPAYPVDLVIDGEMTVREAVARILGSAGAIGWCRRSDQKFTAYVFAGTASGTVIGHIDERDIISLEPIQAGAPVWQLALTHDPRGSVLTTDQMSSPPLGSASETDYTLAHLTVSRRRVRTLTDHPRARDLTVETALALEADAAAEAVRRLAIFNGDTGAPRAYRVVSKFRPFMADLDFLRLIDVSYHDQDRAGNRQVRLGLDLTRFVILAHRVDHTSPTKEGGAASRRVSLTLWRED